jgi:hypothetical protein
VKKSDFNGKLALFILLGILATIFVTSVLAEEEYHIVATLQAPEPESYAKFGCSVAISNGILVVGEYKAEVDGYIQAGKAYIYDLNGNLISAIQSSQPDGNGHFGISVDVVDEIIAVGNFKADLEDIVEAGKTHVFNSSGDHLLTLQSPDTEEKQRFGFMVAVGDEIVLASQLRGTIQGVMNAGSVHMYDFEGVHLSTFLSPSMKINACFGNSLDTSDDLILIGEFGDLRRDTLIGPGSVYIFDYYGNLVTKLTSPDPEDKACFGCSVSISGDKIVVGELYATVDGKNRAGRAYIFDTEGNLLQTLKSPTVEENAEFGCAVAISGDKLVVGEHQGDVESINEGKAYVFDLNGTLLATLKAPKPEIGAQFGYSVATNGESVVVSEIGAEAEVESNAGKVHIFDLAPGAKPETKPKPDDPPTKPENGVPGFSVNAVFSGILVTTFLVYYLSRKQ